jgi:SPP1 gp7 family putative phage head morphogenesis protein
MRVYTAFLFAGVNNPEYLHCTHKYFGEVTPEQLSEIERMVALYFQERTPVAPKVNFTVRKQYGELENVPVLCPDIFSLGDFLPDLRESFRKFRQDDFSYSPHVTTELDAVIVPIDRYALVGQDGVICSWFFAEAKVKNQRSLELRPIKESPEDYEAVEKRIIELFRKRLYLPLLQEFSESALILRNAKDDLFSAIRTGRITYNRGVFSGRFNSTISRELKKLGARWDRSGKAWRLKSDELPVELKHAISSSEYRYKQKITAIDKQLADIVPAEIAKHLQIENLFDSTLWKVDKEFKTSLRGLTVAPELSAEQRKRIAAEWQENMKLWIQTFTEKEILRLRKDMRESIESGNRYEAAINAIKSSYGVSRNKAKFLARQETSLLMTKFKQTRYEDAGVREYRWGCVAGSPLHPVRPWHKALEGKIFRWDNPPVTTKPGEAARRNNPGQDYNCRCFARPIVKF